MPKPIPKVEAQESVSFEKIESELSKEMPQPNPQLQNQQAISSIVEVKSQEKPKQAAEFVPATSVEEIAKEYD